MSSLTAWRTSKARDTYGPIVELVKKQQEVAKKTGLPASYAGTNLAITNKPGQNKSNIIHNNLQFILLSNSEIAEQDMETSQTLALMPSIPSSTFQSSQSASNLSAVGIPGYAAGIK